VSYVDDRNGKEVNAQLVRRGADTVSIWTALDAGKESLKQMNERNHEFPISILMRS